MMLWEGKQMFLKACFVAVTCALTLGCNAKNPSTLKQENEQTESIVTASPDLSPASQPIDFDFYSGRGFDQGRSRLYDLYSSPDEEQIRKAPKWDLRNPNPPLSAVQAMAAAREYVDELADSKVIPFGTSITRLELRPLDHNAGLWSWIVGFEQVQAGNENQSFKVHVLMDGSIAPLTMLRRKDTGWPPEDRDVAPLGGGQSDSEIVRTFVAELNPKRTYAGQTVVIEGELQPIPKESSDRETGKRDYFNTVDGQILILGVRTGWPIEYGKKMKISGRLVGFRKLYEMRQISEYVFERVEDQGGAWDGLILHPGIEFAGMAQ